MSNFTPQVEVSIPCDGDTVVVVFKRLTRAQLHKVAPVMGSTDTFEGKLNYLDVMAEVLPEAVVSFKGLNAGGREFTLNDILAEGYFSGLIDDISSEIFKASFHQEVEEKKSGGSPDEASRE